MRRKILSLICGLFAGCMHAGVPVAGMFLTRADSLYTAGNYEAAASGFVSLFKESEAGTAERGMYAYHAATAMLRAGKPESAIEWFEQSARSFSLSGDTNGYYKARAAQASVNDDLGKYGSARAAQAEVVAYFYHSGNKEEAFNQLLSLALYFYHDEMIDRAVGLYAFIIAESPADAYMVRAKSYNQLGNIWADEMDDEARALELYRRSLRMKILGEAAPLSIVASYNNLGLSHKNLGQLDSAAVYYRLALEVARKSGLASAEINPLINLANLLKRQGNLNEALYYYKEALSKEAFMNVRQRNTLHTNLGILHVEQGNYVVALNHLSRAEALGGDGLSFTDRADLAKHTAQAYAGMGNFAAAFAAQESYQGWRDSVLARDRSQELADLLVRYETAEREMENLVQGRELQENALAVQRRNVWLALASGGGLSIILLLLLLMRRKEAAVREAKLALKMAEQHEFSRVQAERLRISRELHDNLGAYLTVMGAALDPTREAAPVSETRTALREALSLSMRELRKTVWLLNRDSVQLEELLLRLRDFFAPLHQNGMQLTFQSEDPEGTHLSDLQTTHLFRLIQEAVTNACKHGKGTRVEVTLSVSPERHLHFEIRDNGCGFNPAEAGSGNGLKNLHSRSEELRGTVHISSAPETGTRVWGSFPLGK